MKRYLVMYDNKSRYVYAPTREAAILQAGIYGIKRKAIKLCIAAPPLGIDTLEVLIHRGFGG